MVSGIGADEHRNGGVRRLMAVAHYRAVDDKEEGSF
jgi:hypothetical protein